MKAKKKITDVYITTASLLIVKLTSYRVTCGIDNNLKAIKRKTYGYNHLPYLAFPIIAAAATNS